MSEYQLGEQVWIISFEIEDDFYLLSKQTITDIMEDKIECEDDFNTFHVDYADIYRSKSEAFDAMIARLKEAREE
jgi:hypothetical protein